jgi:hypothetical protein
MTFARPRIGVLPHVDTVRTVGSAILAVLLWPLLLLGIDLHIRK